MPQDERVSKFVAAITKEAEEKRAQIEKDTQEYIKKELDKAENEILREAYALIQRRVAAIRSDIGRELSRAQLACRRELFQRRDEIADEVFRKAAQRIEAFVSSGDYEAFLTGSAKKAAQRLPDAAGCTVFVRPDDLKYAQALHTALGECTVEADDTIRLGGVKVENRAGTMRADDTLDMRLRAQRAWFQENCGLTIAQASEGADAAE